MTATRRRPRHQPRKDNPVAAALRRARAERDFGSQITTTRIKLYMLQAGEDATDTLAALAVVIGTPCEAGARIHGHDAPWVRQLHGALRTVAAICLQHSYRWQPEFADAINRAIDLAVEHRPELDHKTFTEAWVEANGMANLILAHSLTPETVA